MQGDKRSDQGPSGCCGAQGTQNGVGVIAVAESRRLPDDVFEKSGFSTSEETEGVWCVPVGGQGYEHVQAGPMSHI